jgi:tetratricopeptide (TPR) repeat protein
MKLRPIYVFILLILWLSAEWRCWQLRHRLVESAAAHNSGQVQVVHLTNQAAIIEPEPADAEGYNKRALAREHQFDVQGVILDFTKAIELKPDYADAYKNRGDALASIGDNNKAIADYTKAIELNPNDADLHLKRGTMKFSKLTDLAGALADDNKAIELKPNDPDGYYSRSGVKCSSGDLNGAVADYCRCMIIADALP